MTKEISNSDDLIDIRDAIERYEELGTDRDAAVEAGEPIDDDLQYEIDALAGLLKELRGNGGDHQWEGDWYPVALIRDSYFDEAFVEQEAEDMGLINPKATWPNNCIDWEKALCEYQMDYSQVEFDGVTYWYR